ncbi:hypothetical protein FRC11_002105, partial [Ceratobasidium sp. 423]
MQAYRSRVRAEAEAAELARTHDEIEALNPDGLFDLDNLGSEINEGEGIFIDNNNALDVEQVPQPDVRDESPVNATPGHRSCSQTATPPPSPPPLDIQYDSDESESDYQFTHAYADPPAIRLAYLNALADHIIRKHPVRDIEISLRNTINCLRLTPNGLPPDFKPLTTLKS